MILVGLSHACVCPFENSTQVTTTSDISRKVAENTGTCGLVRCELKAEGCFLNLAVLGAWRTLGLGLGERSSACAWRAVCERHAGSGDTIDTYGAGSSPVLP